MNKAITDGIPLMPPSFEDGLDQWSSGDGRPSDPTFAGDPRAALVPADPEFGPALELQRNGQTQLRYTGETPLFPGCYYRIAARVKMVSGPRVSVAVGGWAGNANGNEVSSVPNRGPQIFLEEYGRVYEISAIVGSGARTGVDLVWGLQPVFGHFGLDLLEVEGEGGLVRIESVRIEDVTNIFLQKIIDWVDVRDYGAVGDGVTEDTDAFEAANAAAGESGTVLISDGDYFLDKNVALNARTRFTGRVVMPAGKRLALTKNFDFGSYVDAFKDETLALEKALQALFNFSDHESLDLQGRRIQLTRPIDVRAAVANKTTFSNRRVIRNGQIEAVSSPDWEDTVVTSQANYSSGNEDFLTNVASIGAIPVGALVEGNGVGREVYVREVDVSNNRIRLSQPLWGAPSSQTYTFRRFKYVLDFSGFARVQRFNIEDIEFSLQRFASGVILPPDGIAWAVRDCWFTQPKDRGITSIGEGCNGIQIDNNYFNAPDSTDPVTARTSIGFNTNKNDIKIRNNRAVQFRHFGVMAGGGHIVSGNHFFQGDDNGDGTRSAGIVFAQRSTKTVFVGNYVDNAFVEFSNEYDHTPNATANSKPFGTISVTANVFTAGGVPSSFSYIRLAPYGNNHPIDGITVEGNTFKSIGGSVLDRVEGVDETRGTLRHDQTRQVSFTGNSYLDVTHRTESPAYVAHQQSSAATVWTVDLSDKLPFEGEALGADGLVAIGALKTGSNQTVYETPYIETRKGANKNRIELRWSQPVKGTVYLRARVDLPS